MAEPLKHFFDADLVRSLAASFDGVFPRFNSRKFVVECLDGLDDLELLARGGRVAEVMRRHLPDDFADAAAIIVRSLGPELDRSDHFGLAPFRYLPHVIFVGRYGLGHFDVSMDAQYELTKRFSAEWSVRAFLVEHYAATYARLQAWARDPNVHVRRLVSEGTRPRLPWAPRIRAFQDDPSPVIALLELLKDDPERFVQRSVANNLNDIAKVHPDLAADVCQRWSVGAPPGRAWIVGHALRSLVKAGHRGALETLGFASAPKVAIEGARLTPGRVRLGGTMRFSFELVSTSRRDQDLRVDYAVHFVKANGSRRPKVLKLRRLVLGARARVPLEGQVSFAEMTTRTHRPGRHLVELIINGLTFPLGELEVCR